MTFRYFKIFVFLFGLTPNLFAQTNPFAGQWINEKYYNTVMKTKSPMKAFLVTFRVTLFLPNNSKVGTFWVGIFMKGKKPS
jgi:hypothetical protein